MSQRVLLLEGPCRQRFGGDGGDRFQRIADGGSGGAGGGGGGGKGAFRQYMQDMSDQQDSLAEQHSSWMIKFQEDLRGAGGNHVSMDALLTVETHEPTVYSTT